MKLEAEWSQNVYKTLTCIERYSKKWKHFEIRNHVDETSSNGLSVDDSFLDKDIFDRVESCYVRIRKGSTHVKILLHLMAPEISKNETDFNLFCP